MDRSPFAAAFRVPVLRGAFAGALALAAAQAVALPNYDEVRRQHASSEAVLLDRNGQRSVGSESLRISPYADPQSHTFNVRVKLPRGDHGIYPGMYVKVAFVVDETQRLVVPAEAIVHRSEVTGVYVIDAKDRLQLRQIRTGERFEDGMVEVLAGLAAGEQVALDPLRATAVYKEQWAGENP